MIFGENFEIFVEKYTFWKTTVIRYNIKHDLANQFFGLTFDFAH